MKNRKKPKPKKPVMELGPPVFVPPKEEKPRPQWRPEAGSEDNIFGENPRMGISAGDKILLTSEGSDRSEMGEVERVENGAVYLKGGSRIRDDLPRWDEEAKVWTYRYSLAGGE